MHSSNPVFRRSEGFNGHGVDQPERHQLPRPGRSGVRRRHPAGPVVEQRAPPGQQYGQQDPYGNQYGGPGQVGLDQGRMTIDSVVQKTGADPRRRRRRGRRDLDAHR